MRLTYPCINFSVELSENEIVSIIIENQRLFYDMVSDLSTQKEGTMGEWVLSKDSAPIDISKNIDLITQLVPFSINRKELINTLYSKIKHISNNEEMQEYTHETLTKIEQYIIRLTEDFTSEFVYNIDVDIVPLLKMFNLRYNDDYKTLPEKLIEYIFAVNEHIGAKLFIIVNLRSYINDDDAELFFQTLISHKIKLVDIECVERKKIEHERRVIIDNDLCII